MGFFGTLQDYEVSDLIVAHDPVTLERVLVRKEEILKSLREQSTAASVIARIPSQDGFP